MAFCGNCGNEIREGAQFCPQCGKQTGAPATSSAAKPSRQKSILVISGTNSAFERYENGGLTVFTCIAGIITALLALFTFAGKWVSLDVYGYAQEMTFSEVSEVAKALAAYSQYLDPSLTSTLSIISLVATVSYWVLLLGALVALAVSVAILVYPKAEVALFLSYVIICAFAVVGLVFTAAPILFDGLNFMAIPIVMLIIAGIPAVVLRFL